MVRDTKVSEHSDTKFVAESASSSKKGKVILEKWRPPGRVNNRRVTERTSPNVLNLRYPVSLGDVKGVFDPFAPLSGGRAINARSSRRGNEQTRPTLKGIRVKLSDLTAGDSP